MKDQMLKIAGVKSEKEFYKKYPSEEAFMKAHGKEFNKAKLGNAIPKNQNAKYVLPRYDMPRAASSSTAMTYNTPTGPVSTATTGQKKEDIKASTKAMGKAKKTEAKKRREKVAMSTAARESEKYNTPFTFPNGVTKDYADMTADEKAYVAGLSAETAYDISSLENPNSNFSLNELNPLSNILAPMESAIGRSLYEAKEKNSIRPIVSAALNPMVAGVISGIFSPGKSNIAALKSMLDPTKEVKEAIALAGASQEGRLINEAIKQGLKKGTKKLTHEAIDKIKNPSLATDFTVGEGNYGQPQLLTENIFNPNSTLVTKMFKEGGQLHKLQQLTDFGNPPVAQYGIDAPIGSYIINDDRQEDKALNKFLNSYLQQQQAMAEKAKAEAAAKAAASKEQSGGGLGNIGGLIGSIGSMFGKGSSAKKGKKVPKNQNAPIILNGNPSGGFDWTMGSGDITGQTAGIPTMPGGNAQGMFDISSQTGYSAGATPISGMAGGKSGGGGFMNMIGGAQGAGNIIGDVVGGIQEIGSLQDKVREAESAAKVAMVVNRAARLPQELITRKYVRPEDTVTNANQRFPTYGVGTNYLSKNGSVIKAQNGSMIGGNPTEIQNTYNPGDLYSDLGYEPLSDSEIIKQYREGGLIPRAQGGYSSANSFGNFMNKVGNSSNPISAAVNFGTFAITDNLNRSIAAYANQANQLNQNTAFQNAGRGLHGQYSQFMEDGGNIPSDHAGWVSHNWNPQVITKFGDVDVSQIHNIATEGMDTLRTGGRITQNNIFPTDQYALGGELKTTWGGYAEPISHNPYMPGTGETIMFRGKSHEESDGNGHTGIGVKYGDGGHDSYTDYAEYGTKDADADVEVERGEPATEMIDNQTGDKNMVVFGNLKISPMAAAHIGDKNAKGKKYKHYVADLGKQENKQNKIVENATNSINQRIVNTSDSKLENITDHLKIMGANMKLKDIATKKTNASIVQNAVNETAEERGLDADALAKGKIKIDKEAMKEQAKWGKDIKKAQTGDWYTIPGIAQKIYSLVNAPTNTAENKKKAKQQLDQLAKKYNITPNAVKAIAATTTEKTTAAPPSLQLPTSSSQTSSATTAASAPKKKKSSSSSATTSKPSGYVSKYGIEPWKGNITGLGKKTASSFTAEEWDKIADRLGFKGRGNEEFEKFLLANPQAKAIIEKRHQDLYKKSPWIDPKHFGYGWAAPELKNINTEEEYQGDIPLVDIGGWDSETGKPVTTTKETTQPVEALKRNKWMDLANQILPYFRPSDQEPFDQSQLYPELYALATNKVEPVQAQLYHPELDTPYDISLQDQLNANQADFNAIQRQTGYNPEALATLAAQKYAANSKVLGEQFRLNQAEKASVYDRNRQTLNDAQLKNLGILDQQFVRQETAKSRTKEQALEALKSMTDKIAKNKLENRTLGIYENLYNYRFDPSGRAINWNPLAQFDVSRGGGLAGGSAKDLPEGYEYIYNSKGQPIDIRKAPKGSTDNVTQPDLAMNRNGSFVKKNARNGNIVKAIKNL